MFTEKTNSYRSTVNKIIKDRAESCVKEIKQRYDLLFTSQIITKLNDQNLLKEGVFKSLMETK